MKLPYSRALVTGSTGFIGTHLVSALSQRGVEVHELALPAGDITDASSINTLFKELHPEVVFHLAAYGTFGQEKDVQRMIDVNIRGTQNLLDTSVELGVQGFVMAGSSKEYGTSRTPITEHDPLSPWDEYAATKAAAGFLCKVAASRTSLPVTVLRLSPVYGPGDAISRFVPVAIASALSGKPFTITSGPFLRNFTYIEDVVDIFLQASLRSSAGHEVFNVASREAHSFEDVLQAVEKATGKTIMRVVIPPSSLTDDSWVLNASKAKQTLNWEAKISLSEGIKKTLEWYTATQI